MLRRYLLGLVVGVCFVPAWVRADEPGLKKLTFDSGGVKIRYVVQGRENGEPVLLIHGFLADVEKQWTPVIKALVKDYKVIAFDCRGHGDSDKPHDPKKYGLEMVKDAVRLLDHLKIPKAHVVGYSMGGNIALQVAVRYPERVRTLTLGGAGLPAASRQQLLEALAESLEQGKGIGPLIVALTPKGLPKPTEAQLNLLNGVILARKDTKALAALVRSAIDDKDLNLPPERVKGITVPVLALIGEVDPLRDDVDDLKKCLPAVKVVVIDKADHITAFSRPEFVDALKEFLDAQRAKQ
jgi:pimeloyl-ACP methyl ester carboxylesterase